MAGKSSLVCILSPSSKTKPARHFYKTMLYHANIYTHTHTEVHTLLVTWKHAYTHTHIDTHMAVHTLSVTCPHAYAHTHTHTYTQEDKNAH